MESSSGKLRRTILHRALHRPNLLMGGERELVLTSLLIAGALIFTALNVPAFIVGTTVWIVAVAALRAMAKHDPYLSKVYIRQLKYGRYYPARTRRSAKD